MHWHSFMCRHNYLLRDYVLDKFHHQDQYVVLWFTELTLRFFVGGMLDTKTMTNPTDRTVAHLLFHRPLDMLAAKQMEGWESPASSKMGTEDKGKFPKCSRWESHINKQKAGEEMPAGSLALGNEPNSGSSSTVGERVVESSQGNKRKQWNLEW